MSERASDTVETIEQCPRLGKMFGGCNFEARYDLGVPDLSSFAEVTGNGILSLIDRMRKKTYVQDVCTTCGKVVVRQGSAT